MASATKVFIEPIGVTVELDPGEPLLTAVSQVGIEVPATCGGRGTCGKCLVRLGAGDLSTPTEEEARRLSPKLLGDGWRLACQAYPYGERVSIEVREAKGRRQILTTSRLHHGEVRSPVVREAVSFTPPKLGSAASDDERLRAQLGVTQVPLSVLRTMPDTLRDGHWAAVVTRYGDTLIDVEPGGDDSHVYGAAVDIGTSKIITYLFDLTAGAEIDQEAVENPQMRFGEDVITRVTLAMHEGRLEDLTRGAREGIDETLATLYARQGIEARHLYDMTVVGNTAMHHLALGISPTGLGGAPFAPAVDRPLLLRAAELGFDMNPEGGVYFLPPIAGFVGSDCLAVVAATHLEAKREPAMAIDIGTNTEIALVHEGRLAATSCASGPAFEGYQMKCGMKAAEGAVERVSFTADGLPETVGTIGGVDAVGICGSGVVDILAGLVRHGIVDRSGRMQAGHERVRKAEDGVEYFLSDGAHGDIVFTQHDVRALQLAKGAIVAGWTLLLEHEGLTPDDLRHVYVAGAFGNYLDLENALAIDLIPPVGKSRVAFVGNAAGVGAQMALVDTRERERIAQLRKRIAFLELATHSRFHEVFTKALTFA
jgi:uncharacterized 2Fe-2S/4Fe-4S cluster protein (DUF4445 family)